MMRLQRHWVSWAVLVAAVCTSSCGGGSSGFRPRVEELAVIYESAESGTCQPLAADLEVCAAFAPPGVGALCDGTVSGCRFSLSVHLAGLTPGTSILGAVEPEDLSLAWRTSTNILGPAAPDGTVRGSLDFVTDISPGTIGVRAFLFYPPGEPPPALGPRGLEVDSLSELRAPRAEVLVEWPMVAADASANVHR